MNRLSLAMGLAWPSLHSLFPALLGQEAVYKVTLAWLGQAGSQAGSQAGRQAGRQAASHLGGLPAAVCGRRTLKKGMERRVAKELDCRHQCAREMNCGTELGCEREDGG